MDVERGKKLYLASKQILVQNKRVVYNVIYDQCSPSMQELLMGHEEFKKESGNYNVVWLLQ